MSTAAKRRRKGKRVALPRITLLAYGRRDLLEFTTAVESLRHLVFDLKTQVDQLKAERSKPRRRSSGKGEHGGTVKCPKCQLRVYGKQGKCPACGDELPAANASGVQGDETGVDQ